MAKLSAVYAITCSSTEKLYIGSSVDAYDRWWHHRNLLKRNAHHAPYLQHAWNKYGEAAFVFTVLAEVEEQHLMAWEQFYLDLLQPAYNSRQHAESNRGHKIRNPRSPETRARMSAAQKARKRVPLSLEHRAKVVAALTNRPVSQLTREKIRTAQEGIPKPIEVGRKLSEIWRRKRESLPKLTQKQCRVCLSELPIERFRERNGRYESVCKSCQLERRKQAAQKQSAQISAETGLSPKERQLSGFTQRGQELLARHQAEVLAALTDLGERHGSPMTIWDLADVVSQHLNIRRRAADGRLRRMVRDGIIDTNGHLL